MTLPGWIIPFLIEELSEERPGILLWMLEGLHRLLANRYQFTISERSIQNLEAAMADSDNLTQFMQATCVCPLQARHRGTLHLSLPRLHQVVRG